MLAVFIANLPNDHGKKIRSNRNVMNVIQQYVPEDELFEKIEKERKKIRNEKDRDDETEKLKLEMKKTEMPCKKFKSI